VSRGFFDDEGGRVFALKEGEVKSGISGTGESILDTSTGRKGERKGMRWQGEPSCRSRDERPLVSWGEGGVFWGRQAPGGGKALRDGFHERTDRFLGEYFGSCWFGEKRKNSNPQLGGEGNCLRCREGKKKLRKCA